MSEDRTVGNTSRHVAGVWLGLGDDKGREIVGVRLNSGKEVQVKLTATGRIAGIFLDGKRLS